MTRPANTDHPDQRWPALPYAAWKETYATLHMWTQIVGKVALALAVRIWPVPVEIPSPIRFDEDTVHASYDPVFANRFWRILARIEDVFTRSRCAFVGKCSPAHFFWGSFDLAVTRFSGRRAPPRARPAFMRDAYSHEVISHGFWPGSGPVLEPAFYAYAVPEPAGFKDAWARPEAAFYHPELGEFILPYDAVRTAESSEAAIHAFLESTYENGANLAKWDRDALKQSPIPPGTGAREFLRRRSETR